jgi:hypothetical protein
MVTRLEAMRVEITGHWGEDYGLSKEEALELLAVAEAAVAEWNTHRIWQDANDNMEDTDEAWDAVWQKIDAAHDAFRDAIASLLEEKE